MPLALRICCTLIKLLKLLICSFTSAMPTNASNSSKGSLFVVLPLPLPDELFPVVAGSAGLGGFTGSCAGAGLSEVGLSSNSSAITTNRSVSVVPWMGMFDKKLYKKS